MAYRCWQPKDNIHLNAWCDIPWRFCSFAFSNALWHLWMQSLVRNVTSASLGEGIESDCGDSGIVWMQGDSDAKGKHIYPHPRLFLYQEIPLHWIARQSKWGWRRHQLCPLQSFISDQLCHASALLNDCLFFSLFQYLCLDILCNK